MTTKFGRLLRNGPALSRVWLVGLMGLGVVVAAAGCVGVRHGGGRDQGTDTTQTCLDNQFFEVQWSVDHGEGTLPLQCSNIRSMASSVVLLTNAAPPYDRLTVSYDLSCQDGVRCSGSGGLICNMDGTTASGLPVGTGIVEADLLAADGTVLSYATVDAATSAQYYAIQPCDYNVAPFIFTIAQ